MDDLENELTKRTTIKFPVPITADEVEGSFFDFLRDEITCGIEYTLNIRGIKYLMARSRDERYPQKLVGTIATPEAFPSFEMTGTPLHEPYAVFFKEIRFQGAAGYDSIEEFETLPSGSGQLGLIDRIRKATEKYFSQRPKRTK